MKKLMIKENTIKMFILIVLIITSIIQTGMLWLGDMSSPNFLEKIMPVELEPIYPKSIWLNKGKSYRIDNVTGEYKKLVQELKNILMKSAKEEKFQVVAPLEWEEILGKQGLLYEYTIPVSIDELATTSLGREEISFFEHVFINIEDTKGSKVILYLISESDNLYYKMELSGDFGDLAKLYNIFNVDETLDDITRYQPSVKATNITRYIDGNIFLPLTGETAPLKYNVLRWTNPIEVYKDNKQLVLDRYTNELFEKPIIKEVEYREDGSIVMAESMKSIVIYKPSGIIEYVNLDITPSDKKMSMLEGYNVAQRFISDLHVIPESIKHNLYLSQITQVGREYTFNFDVQYKGHKVITTPQAISELGIEHMVSLTVKDKQVVSGKWSLRELHIVGDWQGEVTGEIQVGYSEPINKMYAGLQEGVEIPLLDDVGCVYVIDTLDEDINMQWGVLFDKNWYYP